MYRTLLCGLFLSLATGLAAGYSPGSWAADDEVKPVCAAGKHGREVAGGGERREGFADFRVPLQEGRQRRGRSSHRNARSEVHRPGEAPSSRSSRTGSRSLRSRIRERTEWKKPFPPRGGNRVGLRQK